MRSGGTRWILILLAVLLNGFPMLRSGHDARFAVPGKAPASSVEPKFNEEVLNPNSSQPMVHVASICELPRGGLAATWYGGSREGARDVAIYFASRSGNGEWTAPRAILTPDSASHDLNRAIRKVGNPLLFSEPSGTLWLLYVTITAGGWSGSSLNLTTSTNQGESWAPSQRLTLSPFFNLSELVKNGPVSSGNQSWAVPIYHELAGKFPEILWLHGSEFGVWAEKTRIAGGRSGFQPALVALSTNQAFAFLRDTTARRRISVARTDNGGGSWSSPEALDLPNPDSGLDAIRLADGRLLLAFNDSNSGRENLKLAVSADEGRSWKRAATLAAEKGAEFSYPFLLRSDNGEIHLVYTWKRKAIKHVVLNEAWLDAREKGALHPQ
jgi:predicted neuraminidase